MPYPNFHAARIKDPAQYKEVRQKKDEFGEGINVLYGIKGQGEDRVSEVQAVRFARDKFTPKQAREWLKEHDYQPIEFEEATEEKDEMEPQEKALWDELDAHLTGSPEPAEEDPGDGNMVFVWKAFGKKYYLGIISHATQDLEGDTMTQEAMDFSMDLSRRHKYHSGLYLEHEVPWTKVGRSLAETRVGKNWIELGKFLDTPLAEKTYQSLANRDGKMPRLSAAFLAPKSQKRRGRYTTVLKYDTSVVMRPAHPSTVIYVGGQSEMDEALSKVLKVLGENPDQPNEETISMLKELFTGAKSFDSVEKAEKKGDGGPLEELMGKLDEEGKAMCQKMFAGYEKMKEKAGKYDEYMAEKKAEEKPEEEEVPPEVVPEKKALDTEALTTGIINQMETVLSPLSDRLSELEAQVKSLSDNEQMAEVVASLVRRLPEGAARRPTQHADDLDQESIQGALDQLEKSLGNQPERAFHPLAGLGMGAPSSREGGGA
jgi:hypothetical protein